MERYAAYSNSGIDWITEIPSHWSIKKIKHGTYVKGRIGWKGLKSDEFLTNGYSFLVTGTDFNHGKIDWGSCYHIDKERYEDDPFIQLAEGDLLITKDGTIGKIALVKDLDGFACLNSGIFLVRPTNGMYSTHFLYWILSSDVFTKFIDSTKSGSTINHLYQNVFVEFSFPIPTESEQESIASYLDRKTKLIDDLIAKKERLIELKKEERAAIINQAVTKGLDPNVPMMDSGIEWVAGMPQHWEVTQVKYICDIQGRIGFKGYKSADLVSKGEGAITLGGGNLSSMNTVDFTKTVYLNWDKYYESPEIMVIKGDVIVAQRGTLGRVGYVDADYGPMTINPSLAILKNIRINPEYLTFFFTSSYILNTIDTIASSTAVPMISQEQIGNFYCLLPPKEEQHEIVIQLKRSLQNQDQKLRMAAKQINLLKEYKTTLISEAVTGKIKISLY